MNNLGKSDLNSCSYNLMLKTEGKDSYNPGRSMQNDRKKCKVLRDHLICGYEVEKEKILPEPHVGG